MEILTVKKQTNGYLLNGNMSVPECDGNREYEMIKVWLAEGNTPEPEFTQEELAVQEQAKLKQAKAQALTQIVVEVEDMSFDGNETARLNMISAIQASELLGQTESPWKLADNMVQTVTTAELKQALALAIQEVGRIVMVTDIEEL